MELKTAIEILEYHQEWRLGKREDMIHEPKKLTEALDIVLSEVKKFRLGSVRRSAYAVIPDAERLDIGKNTVIAVFQHRHQAEEWAKSMWKKFYLIEEVESPHFA
jgi:hypothetical protein